MTSLITDIFLLSLLVLIAVMVVRTGKLFAVIVMSGAYSLISAAIFVNLDAVDVAFTEAAVGAGISTVLFLAAMVFLPSEEKTSNNRNFMAALVCVVAGLLLITAALDLPAFGDPNAPIHLHVAPRYLAESGSVLHIPNVVTTVLASYRGFDTLGETIVVFTAGLGVLMLLAGVTRTNRLAKKAKAGSSKKSTKSGATS
jgi:multicomponent Na+:H+ antiporter subunit B